MNVGRAAARALLMCLIGLAVAQSAEGQIRIATYNTKDNPDNTSDANWQVALDTLCTEDSNGIVKPVDIIALQEVAQSQPYKAGYIATMLNNLLGVSSYTYTVGSYGEGYNLQGFVYNTATVSLQETSTFYVGTRPGVRCKFQPVGYSSPDAAFYAYSVHLKAYPGYEGTRAAEAQAIRNNGDALGEGKNLIYMGDFNLTSGLSELAYTRMLNPGAGQAFDPLNGQFDFMAFTYSSTGPFNRLDFQFPTYELNDGEGLDLIPGTYHSVGPTIFGSRQYVYPYELGSASDHLPVLADYQLPAKMDVAVTPATSPVIVGAAAAVEVAVENTANVVAVHGADELDYSISGTGVVTGSASGSDDALGGGAVHSIALDTATPGSKNGQLNVTSSSQAVQDGSFTQAVSLLVMDHSEGSLSTLSNVDSLDLDLGSFAPNTGVIDDAFGITNLASLSGLTADMDILSVLGSGDTGSLFTNAAPATLGPDETLPCIASLDTDAGQGVFSATWTFAVADEALPGSTNGTDLVLNLSAYVAITGDIDLDKDVDLTDLAILASNYDTGSGAHWGMGDFDGDDDVDLTDLALLANGYGTSLSMQVVPEPTTIALLTIAGLAAIRRRA